MKRIMLALAFATLSTPGSAQVLPVPWAAQQPTARDFRETYPRGALADGVEGYVRLACTITDEYKLDCIVQSETPPEYGFGDAALRLSQLYVASPEDPRIVVGRRVTVPVRYALP